MRSIRRAIKLALGLTAGLALTLPATLPAAASPAEATWEIVRFNQNICASPDGTTVPYVVTTVKGTWSTILKTGINNMPPGADILGGWIYPDTNDGHRILGFIRVELAPTPVGVYNAEIWVSDGEVTQTDTLTVNVKPWC